LQIDPVVDIEALLFAIRGELGEERLLFLALLIELLLKAGAFSDGGEPSDFIRFHGEKKWELMLFFGGDRFD